MLFTPVFTYHFYQDLNAANANVPSLVILLTLWYTVSDHVFTFHVNKSVGTFAFHFANRYFFFFVH